MRRQDRIKQMINFIETEAQEKAQEIEIQAEEEFAILKQTRVEETKKQIRAQYERKEKLVDVEKRIRLSNLIKTNRLTVLKRKDAILKALYDKAIAALIRSSSAEFLNQTIAQACFSLNEERVTVLCREEDQSKIDPDVVKRLYGSVKKEGMRELRRLVVEPSLTERHGVVCQALGDQIRVDNTVEFRLRTALDALKPAILDMYFGVETV